jgi:hypothetical protein
VCYDPSVMNALAQSLVMVFFWRRFSPSRDAGVRREARTLLWVCETSSTE